MRADWPPRCGQETSIFLDNGNRNFAQLLVNMLGRFSSHYMLARARETKKNITNSGQIDLLEDRFWPDALSDKSVRPSL